MSAGDFEPAMLILSRAVYAKRQDDCFYPGTLESRLPDGSYLVDFADGGKERVEESEITWLGFWGLPPWMWPRNPVVHTADPTANLQSLEEQFGNISSKEHPANSVPFRALFREADETTTRFDGFSKTGLKLGASDVNDNEYLRPTMNRNSQDVIPPRVSASPASENQTRTSVIRICHNGNLRDENSKSEKNLTSTENTFESPAFRPSFHSNDERGLHFDEHKTVLQNVNSDSLVKKRRLSSPDYEECSIKEKYTRSEHMENRHRNSSPFQKRYTTSPPLPPFVSPHFEDYGHHSFGLSMYESTSPQRPVSFRLQTRARRRSENKKCRKVYGIENRDIWCTQCKWKKACTRFAATEKGDRTGLMYLTDYERLHLSV